LDVPWGLYREKEKKALYRKIRAEKLNGNKNEQNGTGKGHQY